MKYKTMSLKELIAEHKKLIRIMKSGTKKEQKREIQEQLKELKEYIREYKTKRNIIRNCDYCGYEDAINPITGLCPSCDKTKRGLNREYEKKEESSFGGVF